MSEPNVIMDPDLHDGNLIGLVVHHREQLEIFCTDIGGVEYVVTVGGLIALRADDFRQGNIIFELLIHRSPIAPSLVERVFGDKSEKDPPWLSAKMSTLTNEHVLLEVTSSYGCELVALATQEPKIIRR